jgi:hypothetical protein
MVERVSPDLWTLRPVHDGDDVALACRGGWSADRLFAELDIRRPRTTAIARWWARDAAVEAPVPDALQPVRELPPDNERCEAEGGIRYLRAEDARRWP